eukprot:jgi/Mesen1/9551/ME000640S08901
MSTIYVLEPPTRGKVVLKTTAGDFDIELWPKEAPKACRNFVQLCLDGYYDNTIFHRVIKGFMAQGGDPTGTGKGGESIYGGPFIDEIHSRLRFNHRGQVACANAGTPHSNNSQFFITLDACDWLDKRNTIFGKVTGDTVYNLPKLAEVDVGDDDRPLDPPEILSVDVMWNPFDDMEPRQLARRDNRGGLQQQQDGEEIPAKASQKKKKQLNLLSFGEEAEEEEQQLAAVRTKIRSSHDVLDDPRLLKSAKAEAGADEEVDEEETKRRQGLKTSVRQALAGKSRRGEGGEADARGASTGTTSGRGSERTERGGAGRVPGGAVAEEEGEEELDFDLRMKRQILDRRKQMGVAARAHGASSSSSKGEKRGVVEEARKVAAAAKPRRVVSDDDDDDDDGSDEGGRGGTGGRAKKEKLQVKRKGVGSEARAAAAELAVADAGLLTPLEQQRQQYKLKKRSLAGRQDNTLAKLASFKSKLSQSKKAGAASVGKAEEGTGEEEDDEAWMVHKLKFTAASTKGDMSRNEDPNQYVVHDPLLEKGKEKFNKMQAKMKKRNREWSGRSLD